MTEFAGRRRGGSASSALATSRLFVLPVVARRWVSDDNTFWHARWDAKELPGLIYGEEDGKDRALILSSHRIGVSIFCDGLMDSSTSGNRVIISSELGTDRCSLVSPIAAYFNQIIKDVPIKYFVEPILFY